MKVTAFGVKDFKWGNQPNELNIECEMVSDGYHTIEELYAHRIELWILLCKVYSDMGEFVWRSALHSDDSSFDGWFVLGMFSEPGGQITYHLPMSRWQDCAFAETLEKAPEFDGHTAADVLQRLKQL